MKVKYILSSSIGSIILRYITLKQALGREYSAERRIL